MSLHEARAPQGLGRFIVVEGMDNTGKTTLVSKIQGVTKLPLIHSPGPNPQQYLFDWVKDKLDRVEAGEDMLFDRFPLFSEPIYGEVIRGSNYFNNVEGKELGVRFLALKPFIIYCRPDDGSILHSLNNEEHMDGVGINRVTLLEAYDKIMNLFMHAESANKPQSYNIYPYNYMDDPDAQQMLGNLALVKYRRD